MKALSSRALRKIRNQSNKNKIVVNRKINVNVQLTTTTKQIYLLYPEQNIIVILQVAKLIN